MIRLATVILHYGSLVRTRRLHQQLLDADPRRADAILVFDNASPEPYPEAWTRASHNLYWAGAFETVMGLLAGQGATHVWFLNNDLCFVPPAPFIERANTRLVRAEKLAGPVGVYSPAVTRNPYHSQMVARKGGQFSLVRYVDGIAPLVSVDFWRAAGGIDFQGNPYGYGVDVWFSSRARELGYDCVVDHQVVVRHAYHSTAREVDGFLLRAAEAEAQYLSVRLGPDYRAELARMAVDCRDLA
jgi:GT2 family glycosyltransferase